MCIVLRIVYSVTRSVLKKYWIENGRLESEA